MMKKKINPKKILIIRNDKIGDLILSSCSIRELKKTFPDSRIDFVGSEKNKELIKKDKYLFKIFSLNYQIKNFKDIINLIRIIKKIRKERYDIGFDLRGNIFNSSLLFLGRINLKVGFYKNLLSNLMLDFTYKRNIKEHESKEVLNLINKSINLNLKNYWPRISTDGIDKKNVTKLIQYNKLRSFICINPDASNKKKQWPLKNFDRIIKYIKQNYPHHKIVLIGADNNKIDYLTNRNKEIIGIYKGNLREIYLLFKKSNLLLCIDGGIMHIGWASKLNLIAIIPSIIELENIKPLTKNCEIINKKMEDIKIKDVKKSIDNFLKH